VENGTLTKDEERVLDRYLLEYKHQVDEGKIGANFEN
jgi:hypothetical protein